LAEIVKDEDPHEADQLKKFAGLGNSLGFGMIESVHGYPLATLPSAKAVGDWEAAALKLERSLQFKDPQWLAKWEGPVRNRVTGKGGRLPA
jgi:hypothetical protein